MSPPLKSSPSPTSDVIEYDETLSTIGPQSKLEKRRAAKFEARKNLYAQASIIIPLLAMRKYHLPGNNYCQDWIQYIRNNHPLLGIFFHQKLHPLRWGQRIVFLLGSISFGLIVTSFVTLLYAYLRKDMNSILICFKDVSEGFILTNTTSTTSSSSSSDSPNGSSGTCKFSITYGMVTLWTLGGLVHSIFDISLWFLSACCCLLPGGMLQRFGRYRKIGSYMVLILVACMCSMAVFSVILRAKYEARKTLILHGLSPSDASLLLHDAKSFSFILTYLIEQGLSWFVYYFIVVSLLFSGVLGCGCVPVLGGRPYEMSIEWKEKEKALLKQQQELNIRTTPAVDKVIPELSTFEVYVDLERNNHAFVTSDETLPEHRHQYHYLRQQSSSDTVVAANAYMTAISPNESNQTESSAMMVGDISNPPVLLRKPSSQRSAC